MAKRTKPPTIEDLQASIRDSFARWEHLRRHGGVDPFYADGLNMNLVRNHISDYQTRLLDLCKELKAGKCPKEARRKLPRVVSDGFCAPHSKAGPCLRKLSPSARARIIAAQKKRWAKVIAEQKRRWPKKEK